MAVAEPVRQAERLRLPRLSLHKAAGIDLAGVAVLLLVSIIALTAPLLAPHSSNTTLSLGTFHAPVRAAPLWTSSTTRRMPWRSQMRLSSCMNTVGATT